MESDLSNQVRSDCWSKATHCLATSYIFQKKSESFEKRIRINNVLGIIIPVLVGAIAGTYGADSVYLKYAIYIIAPFSVIQAVISGLSLVNKWEHILSYSLESQTANRILSDDFKQLAKYPPSDLEDLKKQFEIIKAIDNERTRQDEKITFKGKEEKKGMRYALKILQLPCAICREVPINMTATDCTNCGNF